MRKIYLLMVVIISAIISLAYHYFEKRKWIIIFSIYSLALILFFLPIFHGNNLAKSLTKRKQDFSIVSKGNTDILLNPLEPNVLSFVKNTPLSLNHALFRPYIFEFKGFSVNLAAFEVLLYQLLFLIFLFFRFKSKNPLHSFNFFGLTLFFHMMLIIGLTIPNIGAIVRYRSIFWLFLLTPIICNTDWKRVFKIIRFSKE